MPIKLPKTLQTQAVLLALITLICLTFLAQALLPWTAFVPYMLIPRYTAIAWDAATQGTIIPQPFITTLTNAFLHGDIEHLLSNMLFLWIFAALAVELLGSKWMLITFIFTAICGSAFHVIMNADSSIPTLGASGAVMGFEGLYLGMATRWKLPDPHIWPMDRPIPPSRLALLGIIGLFLDYMGHLGGNLGVAYSAHLGGFVGGLTLGALIVPKPRQAHH